MKSVVSLSLIAVTAVNLMAATVVVIGLATAGAKAAPAPATTLRTQRLELVDTSGRVRGQILVEDSGEVVFRLRDETGQIRVKLGASKRGSGLVLLDDRTEPGLQMLAGVSGVTNQRDTRLTLSGAEGVNRTIRPTD
jgi:hypothetical protein